MKKTMGRRLLFSMGFATLLEVSAFAAEQQATLDERLAPAPGGGLTANQVAARAEETNFDAAARRDAIVSAEAKLEQAKAAYFPKVTLTARYTRLSPLTQFLPLGSSSGMGGMMGQPVNVPIP